MTRHIGISVPHRLPTCQVCRRQPAGVKGKNSNGAFQWRCQTCHELKNRVGFTKGKQ